MNFQNEVLPQGAVFAAATPMMTEQTVLPPILHRHMAPRGKCGRLVVEKGSLQFVWEDTGKTLDAAPGHPVIIAPERYHHVRITGPVSFKVEFYRIPETGGEHDPAAARPGEQFIHP